MVEYPPKVDLTSPAEMQRLYAYLFSLAEEINRQGEEIKRLRGDNT